MSMKNKPALKMRLENHHVEFYITLANNKVSLST